ncbi:MAG: ABC transporter permease subunit [Pseudomonadota bacterium]|nr:ABC transporter permease subunit [Pseudomonadota bacterium]
MTNILTVAHRELRDDFRNHWALAITGVFSTLALAIAYFGAATAGHVGFTSFAATIASLVTLAAFVTPLIALLVAYDAIVGERERGTLPLLLSYPLSRRTLIAGKFLGHSALLALATLLGLGLALGVIVATVPEIRTFATLRAIVTFMISAALLGASFVALACLISALVKEKAQAAGLALLAWLAFVILFDLVLLAVLVLSGGNATEQALYPWLLLLNPIDVFRLINLSGLGANGGDAFLMAMSGTHAYSPAVLYGALLAWTVLPLGAAAAVFAKAEI